MPRKSLIRLERYTLPSGAEGVLPRLLPRVRGDPRDKPPGGRGSRGAAVMGLDSA